MRKLFILIGLFLTLSVSGQLLPGIVASQAIVGGGVPTVVDTLGYYGAAAGTTTPTNIRSYTTTCTTTGYVDTLYFRSAWEAEGDNIIVAIYDDDEGYPGNLLGYSDPHAGASGAEENIAIPLRSKVNVTNGNKYWITAEGSNVVFFYNDAEGSSFSITHTYGEALPNPMTAGGGVLAVRYRIWGKIKQLL